MREGWSWKERWVGYKIREWRWVGLCSHKPFQAHQGGYEMDRVATLGEISLSSCPPLLLPSRPQSVSPLISPPHVGLRLQLLLAL